MDPPGPKFPRATKPGPLRAALGVAQGGAQAHHFGATGRLCSGCVTVPALAPWWSGGSWGPRGVGWGPGEPLCWLGLAPASRFPVGTQEHTRDENVRYLGTQRAYGVLVLSVIIQMYALCQ